MEASGLIRMDVELEGGDGESGVMNLKKHRGAFLLFVSGRYMEILMGSIFLGRFIGSGR
jgi:hypothetical protein